MIQRLRSRIGGKKKGRRSVVLLYHRIARLSSDPQLLAVLPENFEAQLKRLARNYQPMPLSALPAALADGSLPEKAIAISFDDGYADNLHEAKPLLERSGLHATIFVTSDAISRNQEFWWDTVAHIFLGPHVLPETLNIDIDGTAYVRKIKPSGSGTDFHRLYRYWNVLEKDDPTSRHAIYRELCTMLRVLPPLTLQRVIERLNEWAGQGESADNNRTLSEQELRDLASCNEVEIGCHAKTHSVLSRLPVAAQEREIRGSKETIEDIIGKPVTGFSYPFGSLSDYTKETQTLLKTAGFTYACTTVPSPVARGENPYEIPRLIVRNWRPDELEQKIEECFRA